METPVLKSLFIEVAGTKNTFIYRASPDGASVVRFSNTSIEQV